MNDIRRGGRGVLPGVRRAACLLALLALPAFAAWAASPLHILQPSHLSSIEPTPVRVQVPSDLTGPRPYTLTLSDEEDAVRRVLPGRSPSRAVPMAHALAGAHRTRGLLHRRDASWPSS